MFAGLGGFHAALAKLGHQCVMASEIDPDLQNFYELNHGLRPQGDVRLIAVEDYPRPRHSMRRLSVSAILKGWFATGDGLHQMGRSH